MIDTKLFCKSLKEESIDFYAGVPDSLLKDFCACVKDNTSDENNIITSNEGAAIGLASGYHLATGNIPLVYMQNSGLGNAINPLLSLTDEEVYKIPIILFIGWRGEPGYKDEPQHIKQGKVTLDILNSMKICNEILSDELIPSLEQIRKAKNHCNKNGTPYAFVIKKDTFSPYTLNASRNVFEMNREKALQVLINHLANTDIIVSTTGKLSRELYEYRETLKQGHSNDFLTVGSMGHSMSIALGISLKKKNKRVFCLDGDGSLLMHMGSLSNIGHLSPSNFYHIIFNNGAHESVGAQPTVGLFVNIPGIALASKYKHSYSIETEDALILLLKKLDKISGPVMIEIKIGIMSRENLGRPKTSPIENKIEFMNFLRK